MDLVDKSSNLGDAGAIIGRQGKNIQMLRTKFKTVIQVPVWAFHPKIIPEQEGPFVSRIKMVQNGFWLSPENLNPVLSASLMPWQRWLKIKNYGKMPMSYVLSSTHHKQVRWSSSSSSTFHPIQLCASHSRCYHRERRWTSERIEVRKTEWSHWSSHVCLPGFGMDWKWKSFPTHGNSFPQIKWPAQFIVSSDL